MTWLDSFRLNVFNTFHQIGLVVVLVDPSIPGVTIPEKLRGEARVLLHFGDKLPIPILDLEVNTEGLRATLSFELEPFRVSFPWRAVMAIGLAGTGIFCQFDSQAMNLNPKPNPLNPLAPKLAPESDTESKPEGGQLIPFPVPGGMKDN